MEGFLAINSPLAGTRQSIKWTSWSLRGTGNGATFVSVGSSTAVSLNRIYKKLLEFSMKKKSSDEVSVSANVSMKRYLVSTLYSDECSTCRNTLEYEADSIASAGIQALKKQRGRIVKILEIL